MTVQLNDEEDRDYDKNDTKQDLVEPLVGLGVWKLYHGAFMERYFYCQTQIFVNQLFQSHLFDRHLFMDTWKDAKDHLRNHAMSVSVITGHKRKQPGQKMTEIQEMLEVLDLENEPARRQFADLLGDLRKYHTLLVMDNNRPTGLNLTRNISQPDKKHVSGPQYL